MAILATQRPAQMQGARRNKPPPAALTDAIAYAVGRTYGPGYSFQVRSGIVDEPKGTSGASSSGRHIMDGPGAADVRIFDPQGNQLAGEALTPLAQNWVSNFGSIGVNRTASESVATGWTHMDLVNQPGKGQGIVWDYGGFAPGQKKEILAWAGKRAWTDGQPPDEITTALYEAADATRAASVRKAPPRSGILTSLFGRGDLGTMPQPQTAQSAIASLLDPGGGTQVAEAPSPLMGFAPGAPELGIGPASAPPAPRPQPQPLPEWASNASFPAPPIDEALTGQSADQVLTGGPRPRPVGFWDKGPGGAPDALTVPTPRLDPTNPSFGGPNDRRPQPPMPNMRPEGRWMAGAGGAPDAASVPNPNPRGTPYAPSFPSLYGEQPAPLMGGMSAAMGNAPSRSGDLSAAMGGAPSRSGDLSAAMGGPPAPIDPAQQMATLPDRMQYDDLSQSMALARARADANYYRNQQNIMQAPPPAPRALQEARTKDDAFSLPPDFSLASEPAPIITAGPPPSAMGPIGNTISPENDRGAGRQAFVDANRTPVTVDYTEPAWLDLPDPTPPGLQSPPVSDWRDQFNISFSPGGPGMIADLTPPQAPTPSVPPPPSNPFDALMGPGAAIGAIPFNDVSQGVGAPNFGNADPASWWNSAPTTGNLGLDGPTGGTVAPPSPASWAAGMDTYVPNRFERSTFAGGSVVRPPTPVPGQPGVVQGTMPTPEGAMDIRPPAQGGPPLPPQATPQAAPAQPPRQANPAAERQRTGIVGRVLGGLLGGPIGALGGGLLGGGGGGGGFGFGTASFTPTGGGTAPYMQSNGQMGSTGYQKGTSNALGGSNALSWKSSNGGTVTAYTDPWSGQTFTSYGP